MAAQAGGGTPVGISSFVYVVNLLVKDRPALLVNARAVPGRVAFVQKSSQLLHVGQIDFEQPLQSRPLHFNYYLLTTVQNGSVHLERIALWLSGCVTHPVVVAAFRGALSS